MLKAKLGTIESTNDSIMRRNLLAKKLNSRRAVLEGITKKNFKRQIPYKNLPGADASKVRI